MKFARSKNDVAKFIFISISNFCAGFYRPMSSDITVLLSSPTHAPVQQLMVGLIHELTAVVCL